MTCFLDGEETRVQSPLVVAEERKGEETMGMGDEGQDPRRPLRLLTLQHEMYTCFCLKCGSPLSRLGESRPDKTRLGVREDKANAKLHFIRPRTEAVRPAASRDSAPSAELKAGKSPILNETHLMNLSCVTNVLFPKCSEFRKIESK